MHGLNYHRAERVLLRLPAVRLTLCRNASLTSAISRGIRRATGNVEQIGSRPPRRSEEKRNGPSSSILPRKSTRIGFESARSDKQNHNETRPLRYRTSDIDAQVDRQERKPSGYAGGQGSQSRLQSRSDRPTFKRHEQNGLPKSRSRMELQRLGQTDSRSLSQIKRDRRKLPLKENIIEEAPLGIPYTVAGSEFVYGTFAVTAALEARRRRIHKLYIWRGERSTGDAYDTSIALLARSKNITVQHVAGDWEKTLMRMSGQRPHNGYILEADPIPKLPITALQAMAATGHDLTVEVAAQSLEDQAMNRIFKASTTEATIPRSVRSRFPLLLWLDRITDTGNIGAIIRTAYFYGVEAIIVPEHGTAPFNPVTVKASAGAAEHLPILVVKKETDFINASQVNGWRFFAAVAPDSLSTKKAATNANSSVEGEALQVAPSVLMVGNEGEGLRSFMQQAADASVSIHGVRSSSNGVDSLNVSVAAALLIARFLAVSIPPAPVTTGNADQTKSITDDQSMF